MAKATTTIRQSLHYPPQYAHYFAENAALFNRIVAFYVRRQDVEVHHVQAMRKLHEYPGRPKPEWVKRMIALKRKTLILCKRCHEAIEHGLPITWTLLPLKEVLKRRQF